MYLLARLFIVWSAVIYFCVPGCVGGLEHCAELL